MSPSRVWYSETARLFLLALMTAIATTIVTMANRNVYSKTEIDQRIESAGLREDTRHLYLDREIDYIRRDVSWIVRTMGGTPSASATNGSDTP